MPDCNLGKVFRVLSLSKDHLRHPAPDGPPEIEAGKVPDPFKAEPFNLLCGIVERDLAVFVPFKERS
jgi:hypothetical protein